MGRVYQVFDKLSILTIIVGLLLGGYLAINYNSSNLWFIAVPIIIAIAFIITLPVLIDAVVSKDKHDNVFPTRALIEAFLLNIAILIVCTAFGIVLGSFYIGHFSIH